MWRRAKGCRRESRVVRGFCLPPYKKRDAEHPYINLSEGQISHCEAIFHMAAPYFTAVGNFTARRAISPTHSVDFTQKKSPRGSGGVRGKTSIRYLWDFAWAGGVSLPFSSGTSFPSRTLALGV